MIQSLCLSMILSEAGMHPRIKSEGRLFQDHVLAQGEVASGLDFSASGSLRTTARGIGLTA